MKINIEHYNKKFTIEIADDSDLNDVLEMFRKLLILLGFSLAENKELIITDSD